MPDKLKVNKKDTRTTSFDHKISTVDFDHVTASWIKENLKSSIKTHYKSGLSSKNDTTVTKLVKFCRLYI